MIKESLKKEFEDQFWREEDTSAFTDEMFEWFWAKFEVLLNQKEALQNGVTYWSGEIEKIRRECEVRLSNYAYERDRAKRDRDKAERELESLRQK